MSNMIRMGIYFNKLKREDMFVYLFLNTVVVNKTSFIKHVIFEYIKNNDPEFFAKLEDFKTKRIKNCSEFYVTYKNITNTITNWANLLGMHKDTLAYRIKTGMQPEEAFLTPVKPICLPKGQKANPKTIITKDQLDDLIRKIKKGEIWFNLFKEPERKSKIAKEIIDLNRDIFEVVF